MGEKLHESDRLVIAAQPVPDDLAPLDHHAGRRIPEVLRAFLPLPPDQQAEMCALVQSLPQQERTQPARMPSVYDLCARTEGPGPLVMRLLCNRNMNQLAVAKAICVVTTGGRYWAASSYAMVGGGRRELTPDLLGDLAALLNIPAAELQALTGITPDRSPVQGLGDLVWGLRRLTYDQVQHVIDVAKAMA